MGVNDLDKNKYDVGIIGFWYGLNYGSILTYYGLYKYIEQLGYKPLLVNKPPYLWDDRFYNRNSLSNSFFIRNKINRSRIRKDDADLRDLNHFCNMFVVGSDVVWKGKLTKRIGHYFFMDWVYSHKKKIAYAPSFGGGTGKRMMY